MRRALDKANAGFTQTKGQRTGIPIGPATHTESASQTVAVELHEQRRCKMAQEIRLSRVPVVARITISLAMLFIPGTLLAKGQNVSPVQQPSDPSLYVRADTCKTCHQPEAASHSRGAHWRTETGKHKGPQWQGCEACHGPGKAHVESGGDASKIIRFTSLSAKQASERCLACHEKSESHENFMRSPHLANGVGCPTCHSVHAPKVVHNLLVSAEPALCDGCHRNVEPDFSKPEHHRVNEGFMSCTDCHNPHGSFLPHNLRTNSSQALVCSKCHVDTAGPFVFEHAPLKEQGCGACHNAHGSTNPHLLTRPQINQLCLECHSTILAKSFAPGAPSFHNQATKYSQCVLCHVAIHGSNTDPFLFKR
jgi:DmsE family decaheme c-type cytochrome